ncbi:MAG: S1 RNA-binding domain-containing protein [Clostridiales bacterium]|nr:S1 RNA-binding domain-containing protein [Clostridiales bacterium]
MDEKELNAATEAATTAAEETTAAEPAETMADYEKAIEDSVKPVHEGDILKGTVIGVTEDELTIDLGIYTDGVVKREDASDDPAFFLTENYTVGQEISASVIKRDNSQGSIQLSLKAAAATKGWNRMMQLLEDKSNITVKIYEAVKAGVVTYVSGLRGFIPASKLSLSYVEDLNEWVGKEIEVRVITADPENKKLVLSARDILLEKREEERRNRISNMQVGLVTEGKVESIMPYGIFVNLGDKMSGLVHISQMSNKRIQNPNEMVKEGDTVKVKIIGNKDGKISLSMKALEEVPAEEIEEEVVKIPKVTEKATTSFASLLKGIKID